MWCGAQLLMKSVERISIAQARASVIGASPVAATAAFDGGLPAAPAAVRRHVKRRSAASNAEINQADAIAYLMKVIGHRIEEISPEAATVLRC